MDYIFKNRDGSITQVVLREFQLSVVNGEKEHVIPHSAITHVTLERKRNTYSIEIRSIDFGVIRIGYNQSENNQEQSRQYNAFVRVLHYQLLKNDCKAEFNSGFKPSRLLEKVGSIVLIALLLYSVEEYLDLTPLTSVMLAAQIMGLGGALLVATHVFSNPKSYQPSEIPLTLLPPAT